MLKIENTNIYGWQEAIRSMRNPKNSWAKTDSTIVQGTNRAYVELGSNDLKLATTLANAGAEHGKFLRMINVYFDVVAPLYLYKEMDTYKVGTVCNSCSTMHKITAKEFTMEDFSTEHLFGHSNVLLARTIEHLNQCRNLYLNGGELYDDTCDQIYVYEPKDKDVWWQLIQLLPSSYNQRRTYMMNYQTLRAVYHQRKNHKLDEWHTFCDWIETLPYAKELIIGE